MSLDSFLCSEPEIICLGEALVDRLGPLGGDPSQNLLVEDCLGGAPANVACGLARLGRRVAFIGRVGDDLIGKDFRDLMQIRMVNLIGFQTDLRRPSRIVLVRRDIDGERFFQGFAGDDGMGFADQALEINDLKKSWPVISTKAKWLLIGTIPLASKISSKALSWCIDQARNQDIKIALDVNWRPTFWNQGFSSDSGPDSFVKKTIAVVLEKASLLKLSKEEALWFFDKDDPLQISQSLPQRPDVVVTDGANPVKWLISGIEGLTKVFSPPLIVDTTGAGDAFTAGLLHQMLSKTNSNINYSELDYMINFSAACGALVCTGAGAIAPQPNNQEVELFLSSFSGGMS